MSSAADPSTAVFPETLTLKLFFLVLVGNWLFPIFGAFCLFMPFLTIFVICSYLRTRQYKTALALLLLSPYFLFFTWGVVDYTRGRAVLQGVGYPGDEYFNLDRELRCGHSTSGCLVNGGEILTQLPYNIAVVLMTKTLGFMPGTYTGPYPTESEARQIINAQGELVPYADIEQGEITIDGITIHLEAETQQYLVRQLPGPHNPPFFQELAIKGALFQEECLVLHFLVHFDPNGPAPFASSYMLIRRDTGRPFAGYVDEGGIVGFHPGFLR